MRQVDFQPLLRSTVGFDRFFSALSGLDGAAGGANYPPYSIEKMSDDRYRIVLAVAGFGEHALSIRIDDGTLTIRGEVGTPGENSGVEVLFQGIASRSFEQRFQLAEHVQVVDAALKNGLLSVNLQRVVPDGKKPRSIPIQTVGLEPTVST